MAELIAIIILIGSLLGVVGILRSKIPVLAELPELPAEKTGWGAIFPKLKEKIITLNPFKSFSFEIFLQKILSKIRILTLKTENKTAGWLKILREKSQQKKEKENDSYWEEIKKTKNEK